MVSAPSDPSRPEPRSTETTWDVTAPRSSPDPSTDRFESHDFKPGDTIAGRYRIVAVLGKGGMGEVYRADDLTLGTSVSLKFLPREFVADPVRLERFRSEVRLARQVSHPNICRVYDIVETVHDGHARHFIAMEYIDGEDLASLIRRIGRLPGDKATEIARQLCAGLAAAHEQGIIHRDLKPANIMIDGRGRARVTDFGIAAAAEAVTGHEAAAGTPQYMAPEQLEGREVSKRSDIYSLGLILYEVFSGKRAFEAKTIDELRSLHRDATGTSTSISNLVPDIHPGVERVIQRCLQEDPSDRPPNAIHMAAALPGGDPIAAALAAGETPSPEMLAAVGHIEGASPWAMLGCLAGAVVLAAVVLFLVGFIKLEPRVNLPHPTAVLVNNAQQIINTLGYAEEPAATAHAWDANQDYLDWIERNDTSPDRWDRLSESNQPPPIVFWYRQHTGPLSASAGNRTVTRTDPPLNEEGMILVVTGPEGRLQRFLAVPPADVDDDPPPAGAPPDFTALFDVAGLDITAFQKTDFIHDPRIRLDAQRAWTGTFRDAPDIPLVVHAGVVGDRIASFDILEPWDLHADETSTAQDTLMESIEDWAGTAIISLLILGGAFLSWRNVRLGRVDRRGAARASIFIFLCFCLSNLARLRNPPFFLEVLFNTTLIAGPLLNAALFALFYLAIEPYARRVWPSMFVTWARVTTGKFRDPLVGRDLVVGLLAGALFAATSSLGYAIDGFLGRTALMPVPSQIMVLDPRDGLALALGVPGGSLLIAAAFTLVLVIFRMALRKKYLALLAFAIAIWVLQVPARAEVGVVVALLVAAIQAAILLRFGFFVFYVMYIVSGVLVLNSTALDLTVWYAPSAYFGFALLIAGAIYGFFIATAGRPLFPETAPARA